MTTVRGSKPDQSLLPWIAVGQKIRTAREARSVSLRAFSRQLDVSPGHISQVERGLVAPSMGLLYAIVAELGLSLDYLFEGLGPDSGGLPEVERADRTLGEERFVTRATSRKAINLKSGVRWELLTPSSDGHVDFREIVYSVGGGSTDDEQFVRHPGHEYGVMIKGTLNVQIEFDVFTLGVGDSIVLDSSLPHRFWNGGTGPAHAIWCSISEAS